jgi:hypothetical protein
LERKGLSNKDFLLAQVFFCKKKKCIEVRGMFSEEEAKSKGFYYKTLYGKAQYIGKCFI